MKGKGSLRYESIAAEPAFQSALQAATGNETEIAKLHTKHLSDFGGYYLADVSFQIHTYTQCRFGTNAVNSEFNGVSRFGKHLGEDGPHYILIRLFNFSYLFQVSADSPEKL